METIAKLICRFALGYHLSFAAEGGATLLVDANGNWDYWRTSSRWAKLLRWHFSRERN